MRGEVGAAVAQPPARAARASASCRRRRSRRRAGAGRRADGAPRTRRTRSRPVDSTAARSRSTTRPRPRARPPPRRSCSAATGGLGSVYGSSPHGHLSRPSSTTQRDTVRPRQEHFQACSPPPRRPGTSSRCSSRRRSLSACSTCAAHGRSRAAGRRSRVAAVLFWLGIALVVIALNSPVDELGEQDFFFVHMGQHVLLGDLAPLCFVAGLTGPCCGRSWRSGRSTGCASSRTRWSRCRSGRSTSISGTSRSVPGGAPSQRRARARALPLLHLRRA